MYDNEFETKNKIDVVEVSWSIRIGLRDVFRLLRLSNDCKTELWYISGKAKAKGL